MEINGKRVVDAKSKAVIHITLTDTVKGANKDPAACAAARAAKRGIADCISARVHIGRVYVEQKDKWVRYFTPDALRTEIITFDRGGHLLLVSTNYCRQVLRNLKLEGRRREVREIGINLATFHQRARVN